MVHGGRLRPPHCHHLLRRADRARAHADAQSVDAPLDQVASLSNAHDIAAHDLDVGETLLDVAHHVLLERGVALRRVDDKQVNARRRQRRHTLLVVGTRVDRSAHEQPLVFPLRSAGEIAILAHVLPGDESHQFVLLVDHGQLALLRVHQQLVRFLQSAPRRSDDQLGRHHLGDASGAVLDEVVITRGDDAHQPPSELAILSDRAARKAVAHLDLIEVGERRMGRQAERIENESVLKTFDTSHLAALLFNRVVAVDNSQATEEGHVNGHLCFSHRVHGARDKG
mmetsp:Transcript_620/g.1388  ORF Transcript_620/g.1388 Transcript_620/m.1388 type:complete len:283 (-) Transcript_620:215-1063(-)